jgi:hypothetical protein
MADNSNNDWNDPIARLVLEPELPAKVATKP